MLDYTSDKCFKKDHFCVNSLFYSFPYEDYLIDLPGNIIINLFYFDYILYYYLVVHSLGLVRLDNYWNFVLYKYNQLTSVSKC